MCLFLLSLNSVLWDLILSSISVISSKVDCVDAKCFKSFEILAEFSFIILRLPVN